MSCSVHDVADLEARGVPAVIAASEEFVSARDAQAKSLGIEPQAVWVAHPIQDRTDEEMQILAEKALAGLIDAITE